MPFKTFLAKDYHFAGRRRVGAGKVTVTSAGLDMNSLVPLYVQGETPFAYLRAWYVGVQQGASNAPPDFASIRMQLSAEVSEDAGNDIPIAPFGAQYVGYDGMGQTIQQILMRVPLRQADGFLSIGESGRDLTLFANNANASSIDLRYVFEVPTLENPYGAGNRERELEEWHYAPVETIRLGTGTVGAGSTANITSIMPTVSDLGGSPFFRLIVSALPTPNADPAMRVAITDEAITPDANDSDTYLLTHVARNDGANEFRANGTIEGVIPRESSTSTTLLDSTRVYLNNTDGANGQDYHVWAEIPRLDFQ